VALGMSGRLSAQEGTDLELPEVPACPAELPEVRASCLRFPKNTSAVIHLIAVILILACLSLEENKNMHIILERLRKEIIFELNYS